MGKVEENQGEEKLERRHIRQKGGKREMERERKSKEGRGK